MTDHAATAEMMGESAVDRDRPPVGGRPGETASLGQLVNHNTPAPHVLVSVASKGEGPGNTGGEGIGYKLKSGSSAPAPQNR